MNRQMFKIYNEEDFNRITRGIKVAQCMQSRSSSVSEAEKVLNHLEDLVVSDSLCCSFCNTIFEDKSQQRLHYKLDWHRYNLKQRLNGLRSISEDSFSLLADNGDVSSLSGSDLDTDNEDETGTFETGGSSGEQSKCKESGSKNYTCNVKSKKQEKKVKALAKSVSDSSDTECNEELSKEKRIQTSSNVANRHPKVFFENDDGNIFSIYRCLLHNKKEIPEVDNEMIAQALDSGRKTTWTVIMVGGGHFAAAVFQGGEAIVHQTFHYYTVRAKQGTAQYSRDIRVAGNHAKSAGASLRRYNHASLVQRVQDVLELWSSHINDSSLILYRAVGPHNRTVLFGGKNPPLDKNDARLRPLPFPTRRATFSEVKRVYDILSTMEIYGLAVNFADSFPISPRQPVRKKILKHDTSSEAPEREVNVSGENKSLDNYKDERSSQASPEKQHRTSRVHIDRAKPRRSPQRPLPDIVAKLAQSSSESELDGKIGSADGARDIPLVEHICELNFDEHLLAFQNSAPRHAKNKKCRRQRKRNKRDQNDGCATSEASSSAKVKLWTACKVGDSELLSSLLDGSDRRKGTEEQSCTEDVGIENSNGFVDTENVTQLLNVANDDGNTVLHLAAIHGHAKLVWSLLEAGSDPCNKNKKLQTPYAAANDKETRNAFRRFMNVNPEKFNYNKSQIPGPLTDAIEREELEKKRYHRKIKREKEKTKKKEFEVKRQEEQAKQRFLSLSDKEKRALMAEQRVGKEGDALISRCFQCGVDMSDKVPFEYNANRFCSMPCLKEHRLRNKRAIG